MSCRTPCGDLRLALIAQRTLDVIEEQTLANPGFRMLEPNFLHQVIHVARLPPDRSVRSF